MKHVLRTLLTLPFLLFPRIASAQLTPVVIEAENGAVGAQFTIASLLRGGVVADRLVVKGGGTVEQP